MMTPAETTFVMPGEPDFCSVSLPASYGGSASNSETPSSEPPFAGGSHAHVQQDVHFEFTAEPIAEILSRDRFTFYMECSARVTSASPSPKPLGAKDIFLRQGIDGDIRLFEISMLELVLLKLREFPDLVLGLNVSPQALSDGISWSRIIRLIEGSGSDAKRLILEVPACEETQEISAGGVRLKAAQTLGCRVVADNFGAYGTLLPRFPRLNIAWDMVKLDQSLTHAAGESKNAGILSEPFDTATKFAPIVIVAGVKGDEQLRAAQDVGALYVQGFPFRSSRLRKFERIDAAPTSIVPPVISGRTSVTHHSPSRRI